MSAQCVTSNCSISLQMWYVWKVSGTCMCLCCVVCVVNTACVLIPTHKLLRRLQTPPHLSYSNSIYKIIGLWLRTTERDCIGRFASMMGCAQGTQCSPVNGFWCVCIYSMHRTFPDCVRLFSEKKRVHFSAPHDVSDRLACGAVV